MFKQLRRWLNVVVNQIKHHKSIVIANLAAVLVVGLLAYLIWIFGGGRVTFGPLNSYFFIWLSIIIAITAALNSIIASIIARNSLRVTEKSLELARTTQRPFLNVADPPYCKVYPTSIGTIAADIYNQGLFPADEVSVNCRVFRIIKNDKESLFFPAKKEYPSIYFPSGNLVGYKFEKKNGLHMENSNELRVHITITYRNKLTGENHQTVRAYSMTFRQGDTTVELDPYPKEDYWD